MRPIWRGNSGTGSWPHSRRSNSNGFWVILLEWGKVVEELGHLNGALEIQGLAFDLAVAMGAQDAAVDAARFQGKAYRMLAEWDRAVSWYGVARRVAEEVGHSRQLAAVIDGLANTYRDRGNLPQARGLLQEVMALGHEKDDRYALAIAHHDLMTVERLSGNMVQAIRHGWTAVQRYDSNDGSLKALFDLAGVLRETGELLAARDAYTVVANQLQGFEYRVMALDALAFIAALLGDTVQYQALRSRWIRRGGRSSLLYPGVRSCSTGVFPAGPSAWRRKGRPNSGRPWGLRNSTA